MVTYTEQIDKLTKYFELQLIHLPKIHITEKEYKRGTNSLRKPYSEICQKAYDLWLEDGYEISTAMMNISFFAAAKNINKLTVTK